MCSMLTHFFSQIKKWIQTSSLKFGRTEHVMSLVYGIPTIIGGISEEGFLSSIEQFDKSSASWNVPLQVLERSHDKIGEIGLPKKT